VFGWGEGVGGDVGCECGGIGASEGVIRTGDVVDGARSDGRGMLVVLRGGVFVFVEIFVL